MEAMHEPAPESRSGLWASGAGWSVATAMVGLSWRRLLRDPLALAFTFLAPVGVASIMIGIYTSQSPAESVPMGLVAPEADPLTDDLLSRLEASPVVEVHRYERRHDLERAVRRRDIGAGLVVPSAAGRAEPRTTRVELIGPPDVALPGGVRAAVESAVTQTAASLQLGRVLLPGTGTAEAVTAGSAVLAEAGDSAQREVTEPDWWSGFAEAAILGTLVLFVGMNTMAGSGDLAELRELGILARARTTRASSQSLAVGVGLSLMSYALFQALLILATGRIVFGAGWASWTGLLVIVVVLALAAGGLGVVTGTLLPSAEAGSTVAGPAGFVLGMLGGCLWPLDIVGPTLNWLGHLTPHAWAVEALQVTGIDGGGLNDVTLELVVLLAFAGGLLLLGGWRMARLIGRA